MLVGGRYRLGQKVGAGGMAAVWTARNERTHADVALKIGTALDEEGRKRFEQEARFVAGFAHRNIVRAFDLLEEGPDTLMLVMERLRGETLDAVLARVGAMDARSAVAIGSSLLDALSVAHEQGIVHRDIKPSNVFLCIEQDGVIVPKLLDFGIARTDARSSPLTQANVCLGTPEYMSPEQIRGGAIDGRADLFSTGAILYEMLSGQALFAADSHRSAFAAVLERPIVRPRDIGDEVWAILEAALQRSPARRPASARAMSAALRKAIDATPSELSDSLRLLTVASTPTPMEPIAPLPVAAAAETVGAEVGADVAGPRETLPSLDVEPTTQPRERPRTSWLGVGVAFGLAFGVALGLLGMGRGLVPGAVGNAPVPSLGRRPVLEVRRERPAPVDTRTIASDATSKRTIFDARSKSAAAPGASGNAAIAATATAATAAPQTPPADVTKAPDF
jgi:serine/threonine-protein kinase